MTSSSKLKVSVVLLTTRITLALSSSSCKLRIGSNLQLSCTWHSGPEIHNYSIRLFHRPYTETFSPPPIYCFLGCHSVFYEDPIQCLSRLLLRPLSVQKPPENKHFNGVMLASIIQQGPVVRKPSSANPRLNFNLGFFFFFSKAFSR